MNFRMNFLIVLIFLCFFNVWHWKRSRERFGGGKGFSISERMDGGKKAGVLFYGAVRSSVDVLRYVKENVFSPLEEDGYAFDVFLHSYVNQDPSLLLSFAEQLGVTSFLFTDLMEFDRTFHENPLMQHQKQQFEGTKGKFSSYTISNIYRARNSRRQVYDLFTEYSMSSGKHYDLLVFLRVDILYISALPLSVLNRTRGVINIPADQSNLGVNDRIALGSVDSIRSYGHMEDYLIPCGNWLQDFRNIDGSVWWNPEMYLKSFLEQEKALTIYPIRLPTARFRGEGKLCRRDRKSAMRFCALLNTSACEYVRNAQWV